MDRQDIQTRRAENQVWNGSGAYDAKPELLVFDGGGDADLYGNTVLGLAGRYYRFDLFRPLLNDFHRSVQEGLYTDVFFFVLENAVFRRGAQERPILPALRAAYARILLRDTPPAEGMTDGALRRAWAQQVLGQPCDKALVPVLADIAAPLKPTEAELIRRTEEILYTHFRRARRSATDRQWAAWVGRKRDASGGVRFVRPNGLRALSRGTGGAGGLQKPTLLSFLQGRTPEPILRRYVEDCFGVSLLTPSQLADMERALCTGVHRNCRLHVTDGTPPQRPPSPEAAWDAEQFRRQREKNRAYYQSQLSQNRLTIARLTQKLHNTLLLKQEDDGGLCRAGALCPALAWRAAALDDERVFTRRQPGDPGELIGGYSAGRLRLPEPAAGEAGGAGIHHRGEPDPLPHPRAGDGLLLRQRLHGAAYPAGLRPSGAERPGDGLCVRRMEPGRPGAAGHGTGSCGRQREKQRLLLVLSDASPNDDQRIPGGAGRPRLHRQAGRGRHGGGGRRPAAPRRHARVPVLRQRPGSAGRPAYLRRSHGAITLRGLAGGHRHPPHPGTDTEGVKCVQGSP